MFICIFKYLMSKKRYMCLIIGTATLSCQILSLNSICIVLSLLEIVYNSLLEINSFNKYILVDIYNHYLNPVTLGEANWKRKS